MAGSSSESWFRGVSAIRARTSPSYAHGTTSLSLAFMISVIIAEAGLLHDRSRRSVMIFCRGQNHEGARSSAQLIEQALPSSGNRAM